MHFRDCRPTRSASDSEASWVRQTRGCAIHHITIVCCLSLSLVFASSVFGKVRNPDEFSEFVRTVKRLIALLVPKRFTRLARVSELVSRRGGWIAGTVVVAETLVSVLCVCPGLGQVSSLGPALAALMLLGFTAVLGRAIAAGTNQSCHCFTTSSIPIGPHSIVRNGFLLLLAILATIGRCVTSSVLLSGIGVAGWVVDLVTALVFTALVVRWDDVTDLFRTTA
jgi:hypothetical protein